MPNKVDDILGGFSTVTLEEMDSVKLMNRVDTKFVTTMDMLEKMLQMAAPDYMALVTESGRISPYDSVYYDTPDREMYLMHHCGRLVRTKVRTRTYEGSGQSFLEVKRKNNHRRTRKKRMMVQDASNWALEPAATAFLLEKSGYTPEALSPALRTTFRRITLVNRRMTERLTIDMDLHFTNLRNEGATDLGHAVIIELKQDGLQASEMLEILRTLRIFPLRVSKYCIGSAMTDPALRQNRFKEKIRQLTKFI